MELLKYLSSYIVHLTCTKKKVNEISKIKNEQENLIENRQRITEIFNIYFINMAQSLSKRLSHQALGLPKENTLKTKKNNGRKAK